MGANVSLRRILRTMGPKGHKTPEAQYRPVPTRLYSRSPYSRTWALGSLRQGNIQQHGTAWRIADRYFLTAAHVVVGVSNLKLRSPGQSKWWSASVHHVPRAYWSQFGIERRTSPEDWAILAAPVAEPFGNQSFDLRSQFPGLARNGTVVALGYRSEILVAHSDAAATVGPYVAHDCHTKGGHSGGPVFSSHAIIGLHVGSMAGASRYLASATGGIRYINAAISVAAINWP